MVRMGELVAGETVIVPYPSFVDVVLYGLSCYSCIIAVLYKSVECENTSVDAKVFQYGCRPFRLCLHKGVGVVEPLQMDFLVFIMVQPYSVVV